MNREELTAQLAGLEPKKAGAFALTATNTGSMWDPLPGDWKPEPKFVKEEPDYAAGFQVGDKFVHDPRPGSPFQGRRQAIPAPRYEAPPGSLITKEMEGAYWRAWVLWNGASMELESFIRRRQQIAKYPQDEYERRPTKEELEKMQAAGWGWLKGLWNSRGYTEPTSAQLDEWSREKPKITSQSEQQPG